MPALPGLLFGCGLALAVAPAHAETWLFLPAVADGHAKSVHVILPINL